MKRAKTALNAEIDTADNLIKGVTGIQDYNTSAIIRPLFIKAKTAQDKATLATALASSINNYKAMLDLVAEEKTAKQAYDTHKIALDAAKAADLTQPGQLSMSVHEDF